jgi:hypothetical protein
MLKILRAIVITIVSLTSPFIPSAFSQFIDNFSDGDFTANPIWKGSDSSFITSARFLKLLAPEENGIAFLATESKAISNASWEFTCNLDFNPSNTNYSRIYLVSDQPDLTSALNGYFVMIGGTSDEISLFRQTGTVQSKIIDGEDSRLDSSTVVVKVKVTRDAEGHWELFSDVDVTGLYALEGAVADEIHLASQYFGVYCAYTSTRSDKFSFDDFVVTGDPFVDNTIKANYKDVIITEIFADPSPVVELPEVEYLEIFNRSPNELNITNWTISDGNTTAKLQTGILLPGEHLLIVPSSATDVFSSLNPMVVAGFPSLNNTSDNIIMKSAEEVTIDSIQYTDSWYKDSIKKEGGWSLELIDPNNPCGEEENWTASEDESGGTPARQNSVFANKPDVTGPSLTNVIALSPTTLKLDFHEKLAEEDVALSSIALQPFIDIAMIQFTDETLRSLTVTLNGSLREGELYHLTVSGIRDCNLNLINDGHNVLPFALSETADSLDIIINEILFNPLPTGVDFIELYNTSAKFINLKNWRLANIEDGILINFKNLIDRDFLMFPGSYLVITSAPDVVIGQYRKSVPGNFILAELPPLPDDEGSIVLSRSDGTMIDLFRYSEDFHSALIKDDEGVSLERVSFRRDTNDPQNWLSASSTVGYATPGYMNSSAQPENSVMDESLKVEPEIFQPIYGTPAFTQIHYRFEQGGNIVNAKIFDRQGRLIKVLANNEVLGTEGFYRWDGDTDEGDKARIGYYFVWFEVLDLSGQVKTYRERIVIAAQF